MPSRGSRRRRRPSRRNLDRALETRLRVALELRERGQLEPETALRLVVWPPPGRLDEARYVHEEADDALADVVVARAVRAFNRIGDELAGLRPPFRGEEPGPE